MLSRQAVLITEVVCSLLGCLFSKIKHDIINFDIIVSILQIFYKQKGNTRFGEP